MRAASTSLAMSAARGLAVVTVQTTSPLSLHVRGSDARCFASPAYLTAVRGLQNIDELDLALRDAFLESLPDNEELHGILSHINDTSLFAGETISCL